MEFVKHLSRRRLLRRSAIGLGALTTAGVAAACTEEDRRLHQESRARITGQASPAASSGASASNGAAATTSHAGHTAAPLSVQASPQSQRAAAEEMDRHHEEGVKSFPAKTEGLGGQTLAYTMDGDTKVFNLTAKAVRWEVSPGEYKDAFGYNGVLPGPEIRVTEGDRVRIILKNELPESTAIHWHGLATPNNQDGVPFITQPPVKPGDTYTYEFVARPSGSHMYHSHHNAMEQVGKGLLGPFIIEPKDPNKYPKFDREYTMVLNDTLLGFTLNGKSFPATQPLTAKLGEKVLIRYMNEGLMNHPMHLHGMPMLVVAKDGYPLPNPWFCDNLDVAPGDRWDVIVDADNPGVWAFHCHTLSHAEAPTGMFGLVTVLIVEDSTRS